MVPGSTPLSTVALSQHRCLVNFDPNNLCLESPEFGSVPLGRKRQRNVQRVLGAHVGDLVGGGNLTFQKAVQWLRTELESGTWDQNRFRFRGKELSQEYNRKIHQDLHVKVCSRHGAH